MSLQDKLNENRNMSELFQETKELNELMKSYIRVHMNEEMAKEVTIHNQLNQIQEKSDKVMQHAINFEHARQDVRRKRREFASDFDKWTRGNGKEQQQDGKSSSRDAKIERGGIESDKQRNKH